MKIQAVNSIRSNINKKISNKVSFGIIPAYPIDREANSIFCAAKEGIAFISEIQQKDPVFHELKMLNVEKATLSNIIKQGGNIQRQSIPEIRFNEIKKKYKRAEELQKDIGESINHIQSNDFKLNLAETSVIINILKIYKSYIE